MLRKPREEVGERRNIPADTRAFQRDHIPSAVPNRDDDPGESTGGHHHIHQEAPDAAISIHVGMNVDEEEMSQHNTDRRVRFFAEQIE
jgi:hypothetical protein